MSMEDKGDQLKSPLKEDTETEIKESSEPTITGINSGRKEDSPNIKLNLERGEGKKRKPLIIAVIIILLVLGAGAYLYRSTFNTKKVDSTPSVSETASPQPTVTPEPLTRSEWSLEVLNGTGRSGLAKTVAAKIQEAGYPVVKVGNADKSNFDKTEIQVKKELLEKIDLVIADLKDTIKIASVGGELKDSTASARIIIGRDSI